MINNKNTIKNIFFDLDGTLFCSDECERNALRSAFKTYGISINDDIINRYKEINKDLWERHENNLISREDVCKDRFIHLLQGFNIDISITHFGELYLYFLSSNICFEYGALEVLLKLSPKYRLYVVTNGIERVQMKKIANMRLMDLFEDIFISEIIGHNKPNIEFFEYCLLKIKCKPEECIVIGDSLSSDILGGKNAKIVTCWYNPGNKQNNTNIIPDYQISCLLELVDLLNLSL